MLLFLFRSSIDLLKKNFVVYTVFPFKILMSA